MLIFSFALCLRLDDLFKQLVHIALANARDNVVVNGNADPFGTMVEAEGTAHSDLVFQAVFGDQFFQACQNGVAAALVAGTADTYLYFHFFNTPSVKI